MVAKRKADRVAQAQARRAANAKWAKLKGEERTEETAAAREAFMRKSGSRRQHFVELGRASGRSKRRAKRVK